MPDANGNLTDAEWQAIIAQENATNAGFETGAPPYAGYDFGAPSGEVPGAAPNVPVGSVPGAPTTGGIPLRDDWQDSEERIIRDILSNQLRTQAENRNAVLSAYGDVAQRGAYAQSAADNRDNFRLGVQAQHGENANARDAATEAFVFDQAAGANARDEGTLGALTGLYGETAAAEQGALGELRGAQFGADSRDLDLWSGLRGESGVATAADQAALGEYGQAAGGANARDQQLLGELDAEGGYANSADAAALYGLTSAQQRAGSQDAALFGGLQSAAGTANSREDAALGGFEALAGRMQQLEGGDIGPDISSEAALAEADPESIEAQKWALGRYQEQSDPSMSATERLMMEQARRTEEQDRRAAMDAALRNLQMRGMGGSGAEIGAMLGAQQTTSQNRMLQDMAAQASAQQRAERAQAAAAGLAGNIRASSFGESMDTGTAADIMAQFNRNQSTAHQRWQDEYRAQQQAEAFQRGETVAGAQMDAAGTQYSRAGDVYGAGTAAADRDFARQSNVTNTQRDATDARYNRETGQYAAAADANQAAYGRATDQYGAQRDVAGTQFDRAGQVYDAGTAANERVYGRAGDVYGATTDAAGRTFDRGKTVADEAQQTTQAGYGRVQDVANLAGQMTERTYGRGMDYLDRDGQATQEQYNRERDRIADTGNYTSLYTNQGTQDAANTTRAYETELGYQNLKRAEKLLEDDDEDFLSSLNPFG